MNILFLSPGAYGVNGGIGLYNRDLVEAMVEADPRLQVTILQRLAGDLPFQLPPRTTLDRSAEGGKIAFMLAVGRQMLSRRYDLVVCAHINLFRVAQWLARRHSCPLILLVYGIEVWQRPERNMPDLGGCDAVWSISQITTDRMNAWAGLPPERYVQLPNAIQLDRYAMGPKPAALVDSLDLRDKQVILTLTRLPGRDRHKGVDEMLELLPALLAEQPNIHYVVAGDGVDLPRLVAKAHALGVQNETSFVGFVDEARKADYFRLADVFALPGRGEGFGFVFLEALACGIPCVGSRVDGSREALRDGMLGQLVDPDDLAEIATAIERALAMPKEIPEGLEYFSWPHFVERAKAATIAASEPKVS